MNGYPVAQLRWIVECAEPYTGDAMGMRPYEPISAFNVDSVATKYAADCQRTNPRNVYRVSEISFTKFGDLVAKTIYPPKGKYDNFISVAEEKMA